MSVSVYGSTNKEVSGQKYQTRFEVMFLLHGLSTGEQTFYLSFIMQSIEQTQVDFYTVKWPTDCVLHI